MLIAIDDSIPSSLVSSSSPLEIVRVCIQELTCHFILCTVYVPPNIGLSYFQSLISFLSDILSRSTPCIIVGDFNLPTIYWSTLTGNCAPPPVILIFLTTYFNPNSC